MPVDINSPLEITMTAGEWNVVIDTLTNGPYRTVAPLIQKIVEQAQKAENFNQGQDAAAQGLPSIPRQRPSTDGTWAS